MIELLMDATLILTLWGIAAAALFAAGLFRAVVLFITFGLLMAIVWIRLDAPDVALAEAAIGAGVTGALLLDTVAHLRHHATADAERHE